MAECLPQYEEAIAEAEKRLKNEKLLPKYEDYQRAVSNEN